MIEELDKLVEFIQIEYLKFNGKWQNSKYYSKVNFKSNIVLDILNNELILNDILNYREFINENNIQLIMDFKQFNYENVKVNIRVKAKNSIEYKIKNYTENHENGEIPIIKCLNDLFGIRIIFSEDIDNNEVINFIKEKYHDLKCIKSIKDGYKAVHIYFGKDNFSFPWELQVWNKSDEVNNINSHEKYKEKYVKWEKENKGGIQ